MAPASSAGRQHRRYPKASVSSSLKRMGLHLLLLAAILGTVVQIRTGGLLGLDVTRSAGPGLFSPRAATIDLGRAMASSEAAYESYDSDVRAFLSDLDVAKPLLEKRRFHKLLEVQSFTEAELPFDAFRRRFEQQGMPVVVRNLTLMPRLWDRDMIRRVCGASWVSPLVPDVPADGSASQRWAGLKKARMRTVAEFLDALDKKQKPSPYMHDWPIPDKCPQLLQNYTVPKYFTQDYLRKVKVSANGLWGYVGGKVRPSAKSWPSLFIGEKSTGSGMHIDSGDTHFVMYMIEGVKEFRLIRRRDRIVAYEDRAKSYFMGDLFKPDFDKHPLLSLATVYKATLRPGDMLFIPGGSPHQVVNHEPIISISTNYVDETNVVQSIKQLREQMAYEVADSLEQLYVSGEVSTLKEPASIPWTKFAQRGA